jgi:hypothetical protein
MMVYGMGGIKREITGRDSCQSDLMVFTNSFTGSPPLQTVMEKGFMIEFHSITHDIVSSP